MRDFGGTGDEQKPPRRRRARQVARDAAKHLTPPVIGRGRAYPRHANSWPSVMFTPGECSFEGRRAHTCVAVANADVHQNMPRILALKFSETQWQGGNVCVRLYKNRVNKPGGRRIRSYRRILLCRITNISKVFVLATRHYWTQRVACTIDLASPHEIPSQDVTPDRGAACQCSEQNNHDEAGPHNTVVPARAQPL
mmetsp:Transcript_5638/g.20197  ORF Transcript_5638/g.20197 Transcript_5638/m.20197 type:complete len:196 (+) Transcript_5638:1273-1860(+)